MTIDYTVDTHWNCRMCQINGIPHGNEKCGFCEYTGNEINKWIQDRKFVNFLIDEHNKGNILIKP